MIFHETAAQGRGFLLLMCAGLLSGALYDLFALLRRRLPRTAAHGLDALWCLLTAGACLLALAVSGEHRARLYALLGLCCGGAIYLLGIHSVFVSLRRFFQKRKRRENP